MESISIGLASIIAIATLLLGCLIMWLWMRSRVVGERMAGRGEANAEVEVLREKIKGIDSLLEEKRNRHNMDLEELELLRVQFMNLQKNASNLEARAERTQQLEMHLYDRDQNLQRLQEELRKNSAELATRSEQASRLKEVEVLLANERSTVNQLQEQIKQAATREQQLKTLIEQERISGQDKIKLLTEAREVLSNQFKALANDIMEEKSKRFTEQNQQNMAQLLSPLQERMQNFGKLVQDTYEKDSKERLTLENELKRLQELNTRLNEDATALTNALTGSNNKAQGNWGEMVLESVLESSGLTRGREFSVQVSDSVENEDGSVRRTQPDVIINLPEDKQIIIDSKVSLNAYVRYTKATNTEEANKELKSHINAMRNHIRSLSEKRYQDIYKLKTLDFVFMFVPVEPAYLLAVQHDENLFSECFERRIMLVGPSTLLATLRTVASIWRYEYQNQNAVEIARQSGQMYDKFVGFVQTLEKLGKQLQSAQDGYQQAMRQLQTGSGNLIGRAEKLLAMGVKANKRLNTEYEKEEDSSAEELINKAKDTVDSLPFSIAEDK
ncbi:DNA recombination protein RmuC [Neisseria sp. Ec49-e6-T10]|uniref:DNA recombination protein RmuC n=1 Tax=Neisseria sp. Ec49-e6-T10 TaxID=3140744 RepID=UPI003EC07F68